jgi:hypothetical protein
MPNEPLALPASIRFYLGSRANRNALDLIIRTPVPPGDLRWSEVLAFHDATITAQRVQLDFFALLYNGWNETWGDARKKLLPLADQPSVSELLEADIELTPATVWGGGGLWSKIPLRPGCVLWAGFECSELKEFQLYLYVQTGDEDYSLSDNLVLGNDWLLVDAENYRATIPGLCPIAADKADLSRLAEAAFEALDRMLKKLNEPTS